MKHILLVDDHAIVRKGLKEALTEEVGDLGFGEAANGPDLLTELNRRQYDLVILDLNLEGRSGLEWLTEIQQHYPRLPVLILSMYPVAEFAVRALKQGAAAYLNKQSAPEELADAVTTVLSGKKYISPEVAERLAEVIAQDSTQPAHQYLSAREYQIMLMIAGGRLQKEIAAELSLSAKTVSTYHTRVLKKLGLKNAVEVTRYALQNNLLA